MPVVASRFSPPLYLRSGHVQTLLPVFLPRCIDCVFARERLELADGDFVDLDWLRTGHARLAILIGLRQLGTGPVTLTAPPGADTIAVEVNTADGGLGLLLPAVQRVRAAAARL